MTDIVDRLRKYIHSAHHTPALIREAAAEIERLTAEREALRAVLQELVLIDEDEPSMDSYRWPIWYNKRESAMYDAHKALEEK